MITCYGCTIIYCPNLSLYCIYLLFFLYFFFFFFFFFFFQAEDGIRDVAVTGVQTCALPISLGAALPPRRGCRSGDCCCRRRRAGRRGPAAGRRACARRGAAARRAAGSRRRSGFRGLPWE